MTAQLVVSDTHSGLVMPPKPRSSDTARSALGSALCSPTEMRHLLVASQVRLLAPKGKGGTVKSVATLPELSAGAVVGAVRDAFV